MKKYHRAHLCNLSQKIKKSFASLDKICSSAGAFTWDPFDK